MHCNLIQTEQFIVTNYFKEKKVPVVGFEPRFLTSASNSLDHSDTEYSEDES